MAGFAHWLRQQIANQHFAEIGGLWLLWQRIL
jgi:hypothetical protein